MVSPAGSQACPMLLLPLSVGGLLATRKKVMLLKKGIFGEVVANIHVIEWQRLAPCTHSAHSAL